MNQIPPWMPATVFLALLAVVAVALVVRVKRQIQQRADDMKAAADAAGFAYEPAGDKEFVKAWAAIKPLPARGKVQNIVYGRLSDGLHLTAFEHTYVVSTGKTTHVIAHSVFAVDTPAWPKLSIERRSPISRWLRGLFTGRAAPAAQDPRDPVAFELRWVVQCGDPGFAERFLRPAVLETLDSIDWASSWWCVGGKLALIARRTMTQAGLVEGIAAIERLWRALPEEFSGHPAPLQPPEASGSAQE